MVRGIVRERWNRWSHGREGSVAVILRESGVGHDRDSP